MIHDKFKIYGIQKARNSEVEHVMSGGFHLRDQFRDFIRILFFKKLFSRSQEIYIKTFNHLFNSLFKVSLFPTGAVSFKIVELPTFFASLFPI